MLDREKRDAEIVAAYKAGASPVALSKAWGLRRAKICKIINDARIAVHGKDIIRRYQKGERPTDIAASLKFTQGQVTGYLKAKKALKPRIIGGISGLNDRGVKKAPVDFDWGRGFGRDNVKPDPRETHGRMWHASTHIPTASSADLAARG